MAIRGRKKISRKKPGETKTIPYFDMGTQDAIVAFQNEPDIEQRKKIYIAKIMPAFDSLIENLINTYKFHVLHETKEDLKAQCMEDLYGVITKFNVNKGSKAFSYFNVVAKNWLTIRSKNNTKSISSFISLDNKEAFSAHEQDIIDAYNTVPSGVDVITHDEFVASVHSLLIELKKRAKMPNEIICINAIITLFNNSDKLDVINKRATMLFLREISSLTPKQMSVVLAVLKKLYRDIKAERIREEENPPHNIIELHNNQN
jgi:hypothetical protein